MSRIHEALKKAEQERAAVQVTDPGLTSRDALETDSARAFSTRSAAILGEEVSPEVPVSAAVVGPSICGSTNCESNRRIPSGISTRM